MNPMFDAMNAVAASSWNLMEAGIAYGIGPGEEALTDLNLILLRQLIPALRVKKFSKWEEARNGADWEWWIGSSREEQWIKLRVQAKRSSHGERQYDQLKHESKLRDIDGREILGAHGKAMKIMQYDALIARSRIDGAIPLHVFYNGWPEDRYRIGKHYHDAIARHWRAARDGFLPSSAWDSPNWGCTVSSAETVKHIYENPSESVFPRKFLDASPSLLEDNRYVPRYLVHSTPWSHLFRSNERGAVPTVREIAENLHLMRGKDGPLTDDEFDAMTYANLPQDVAALGGVQFRGADRAGKERALRQREGWSSAEDFLTSLVPPSEDLGGLLEILAFGQSEIGYKLFLDVDQADAEPVDRPNQRG
ncbi:DUF6615 family protein [Prescottella equi]|uniref:DUF6615 family protein n=1 Tax=Rhodococcus hoagii TaxID=43767 RepID=UPI001C7548EE|nr:DUF6615 family protein [Prescottella equi]BCN51583.1 hypothetical protein RE9416_48840 [Prescottella equi]BCN56604.1 hypothetical protein RE9425_49940 [Prescottella equi]BCN61518.1 hypothetical protein RE9427_48880 [Prescottella equi]BCN86321.1 hypothetical protein RE0356_49620 [Prescottella equi]